MKTALCSLTAAMLAAKFLLTAVNGVLWPLGSYPMFSHPLHLAGSFLMLEAEFENGEKEALYPWSLLPMDIYRSYRLVESGGERLPSILSAIMRYANDGPVRPRAWRPRPAGLPGAKRIRSLKVIELPLRSFMRAP